MSQDSELTKSPLGKNISLPQTYMPSLLFPVPRQLAREKIGMMVGNALPFEGYDLWTGYEFSWLNEKGKPEVRILQLFVAANSMNLIESKSFKLYLNGFYRTKFQDAEAVKSTIERDLAAALETAVRVEFFAVDDAVKFQTHPSRGIVIDSLDVATDTYHTDASFLRHESNTRCTEVLVSHLLRSVCPVTGQPDWASILIEYTGSKIDRAGLLKYLISYREHKAFHEACCEQIFFDIQRKLAPEKLLIETCVLRRGGLDIVSVRANHPVTNRVFKRLVRQ